MLFYLEAKVSVRVTGISGPFQEVITWLVNANNIIDAKEKFKAHVRSEKASALPESINFEFIKIAGELR